MRSSCFGVAALAAAWTLCGSPGLSAQPADTAADPFDVVVLDPGHGGDDLGAQGPRGQAEKDLVLDVARRLAAELRARGLHVVPTRDGDQFVALEARTAIANDARADLFVSIHANASPSPKPMGIETYFQSLEASDDAARMVAARENEAFARDGAAKRADDPFLALLGDMIASEHLDESKAFAAMAQRQLADIDRVASRGVKQAPFVVLKGVQMPSSLVEIGFLTNEREAHALRSDARRAAIARALARAILDYGDRHNLRRGVVKRSGR